MQYRPLGRTGLSVSALSLGGVAFGDMYGALGPGEADRCVRRAVDFGVNHQPGFMKLHIVKRNAERLARKTIRAVARHDVARGYLCKCAITIFGAQNNPLVILLDRNEFGVTAERDMRKAREARDHRILELGLEEEIVVRPAEALRQALRAEITDHSAVRTNVDVTMRLAHQRQHGLGEPDRLEDAHHLVIDVHGARQRIGLRLALDYQCA